MGFDIIEINLVNQYKTKNVNLSTTKSKLAAELGPAQPQLDPLFSHPSPRVQIPMLMSWCTVMQSF